MSDFLNIISWLRNNKYTLIVVAVLCVIMFIQFEQIHNLKVKNKIIQNNYEASLSSMDTLRLKNGALLAERKSYVLDIEELHDKLGIANSEIRELRNNLTSNMLYISKLEMNIKLLEGRSTDTIYITKDSLRMFKFNIDDKWYNIAGHSTIKNVDSTYLADTSIDSLKMNVPLTVGLTEDWTIFVKSENPYMYFNNIDGALLDKEQYLKKYKRKWRVSVYGGFNVGYDLNKKGLYYGPGVGIGVSYTIF